MSQIEDPEPPSDLEQRSVIDKLAQFVARNGPDFERMTMEKQQGNPQFAFLFGGEHSDYYKHKVEELKTTMQQQPPPPQMMSQQQPFHPDPMSLPAHPQWGGPPYNRNWEECGENWGNTQWPPPPLPPQGNWGSNWGSQNGPPPLWCRGPYPPNFYPPPPPPPPPQQTPLLTEEDVKRSEVNLKAQYDKIIGEEKPQAVRQCLDKARMDTFISTAATLSVNPEEFSSAIQPLIEICTKENIAKGKNWAVELMSRGEAYANLVVDYLLLRAQNMDASFETRLHIVYLINDLLHFLKRHSDAAHFQSALNRIVVPVYSLALEMADGEKKVKLIRVLSLWETNAYLPDDILKKMKEEGVREAFMKEWKVDRDKMHAELIAEVEAKHTTRYEALKKQHDDFADHVHKTLVAAAESEHSEGGPLPFPDFSRYGPPPPPPQGFGGGNGGGWGGGGGKFDPPPCWHGPPPFMTGPPPMPGRGGDRWGRGRGGDLPSYHPDDDFYDGRRGGPPPPHMPYRSGPSRDRYRRDGRFDEPYYNHHHHQDDRSYRGGMQHRRRYEENEEELHHSGDVENQELAEEVEQQQQANPPSEEDLIPKVPFWQLPAGLMHPLIGPKDFDFTPLDPAKLRLLPPEPPSEQLMLALDAYYVQPSHDRPRDPEGWERLGLFEFYRSKEEARNRKESEVSATVTDEEEGEKSGSVSPGDRSKNQGLPQLAYLTAYPKSAIGQAIRTGPAALIATPPPNLGMPKMNAQFAAAAAVAAVGSGAGSDLPRLLVGARGHDLGRIQGLGLGLNRTRALLDHVPDHHPGRDLDPVLLVRVAVHLPLIVVTEIDRGHLEVPMGR
ncbi:Calcium homeostasi endoplasmic reticulum protein [Taenia solium]|eukprot:TsM_001227700 transcript=TsM_001227700 gene=TsM_001227700